MHNRGAPAAVFGMVEREGNDMRMLRQDGMDSAPKVADALAVDDPDLEELWVENGET